MKKNLLVLGMVVILALGGCIELWAEEILDEEKLLFTEIPMVVTAARYAQPIKEAPSSISVITSEDIRLSGADNIPDVLRTVAGVDVLMLNAYESEVSTRGFDKMLAEKMLVLIDGRSVYQDFFGGTFWKSLPVTLEEIARIEIIRGPGSALYGANAFCGVINIISKTPEDLKGSRISARYGEYKTLSSSLILAEVTDKFGWKVSANWDETNQWWDKHKDAYRVGKENIQVDYHPNDDSTLSLIGSYVDTKDFELGSGFGTLDVDAKESCTQVKYCTKDFKLQVSCRQLDAESIQQTSAETTKYLTDTYDMEFQHLVSLKKNNIIWGGTYRHNAIDKGTLVQEDHAQNLWAGFIHNEYCPKDNLAFFAGVRYDYHPLTKENFSPRASMIFSPTKKHSLRISAGTAFRNPTFLVSYLHKDTIIGPITFQYHGKEDIQSEQVQSYELGYQFFPSKRMSAKVDLFANRYKDFISSTKWKKTGTTTMYKTFENRGKMLGIGGEMGFDLLLTDWLFANMNYSYQKYTYKEDDPTMGVKKDDLDKSMPKHKINTSLRFKPTQEITANLSAHYVDDAEWLAGKVDDYTMVNARIGYRFFKYNAEVFLAGFNIFNHKHYEFAPGIPPLYPAKYPLSDEIGRKVSLGVNYEF